MVHALTETHRVLKPNGILVDLRPALKHRHAGLGVGSGFQPVGVMREDFEDDHAANRAVAHVLRQRLFRQESRTEFDLDRVMDSLDDFRAWLDDFGPPGKLAPHEWLHQRLAQAQKKAGAQTKITVRGPLRLAVLRKI